MNKLVFLLASVISLTSFSLLFAKPSVLPTPWQGWVSEGLRYDSYDKGARIDCTYSCDKDSRHLQVTMSTEQRNIAQAEKKLKAYEDPQYLAVMNSFPGAHIRIWKEKDCTFLCEANDKRRSTLLFYHPKFMGTLKESGASEEKLVSAFSHFDLAAIKAWAEAPYDPRHENNPPLIVGATGEESAPSPDVKPVQAIQPIQRKTNPPETSEKNKLSDWLPSIEGLTKKNARSKDKFASVRYTDGSGKDVGIRISTNPPEAEGTYGMICGIEGSPFRMQHFAKSSYDVTIVKNGSFKIMNKISKNVGAPISTISASNGRVVIHVNGPRTKNEQVKQLFEALDLSALEKAFPGN